MSTRSGRIALTGRRGERYSWVYWAATGAGFAFLIVDIFDDSALWNYAVIASVVIAIAVRPGGVWGRRATATADEQGSRDA
jgi:hypothetical protein